MERRQENKDQPGERQFAFFRGREDFGKVSQEFKRKGLPGAARLLVRKFAARLRWWAYYFYHRPFDRWFDHHFGVDTCGVRFLSSLTVDSSNKALGLEYEPTPVRAFPAMLAGLPDNLAEFIFVDFGSGKGRTLLLASSYNFKAIIGVEFARELNAIAQNNIGVYRSDNQQCADIRPTLADAAAFSIPGDKCVFYFYYPFREDVMRRVLANIARAYAANPRKMYFINRLDKPDWVQACETQFAEHGFVRRIDPAQSTVRGITAPFTLLTYETVD